MKKNRRGTSNAAMRGYLKIMSMTNKAIVNDIDLATRMLIKQYRVPYERASTIAKTFQHRYYRKG